MVVCLCLMGAWILLETIILVKQVQREHRLEEIINQALSKLDQLKGVLAESKAILSENPRLKEAFEHDDEVGDYFKKLVSIQNLLEESINGEDIDNNEEGEK